jgi:ERCC4-type nuclease
MCEADTSAEDCVVSLSTKVVKSRYDIPDKVTVQVDTREKFPMLFPSNIRIVHPILQCGTILIKVVTEKKKLDIGDYRLAEYPDCCVIERKASQLELFKNLMEHRDSIRQAKAFRKLATVEYPVLMVEASPSELLKVRGRQPRIKYPELIVSKLSLAVAKYGFHLFFIPWRSRNQDARRKVGTMLVHMMLAFAIKDGFEIVPETL